MAFLCNRLFPRVRTRTAAPQHPYRTWLALLMLMVSALAQGAASALPLDRDWVAAAGSAEFADGVLRIAVDGDEQALVMWPGSAVDSREFAYLTIRHEGLSPLLALELAVRAGDDFRVIEIPHTGGSATLKLSDLPQWQGRVDEIGLALRPAQGMPTLVKFEPLSVHELALHPADAGLGLSAWWTAVRQYRGWGGRSTNVLPEDALVPIAGGLALLAVAVLVAARRRGGAVVFAAGIALALSWVVLEVRTLFDLAAHRAESRQETAARTALAKPAEPDWFLVEFARALKAQWPATPQRPVVFLLGVSDTYAAHRLRFHLVPAPAHVLPPEAIADPHWRSSPACVVLVSDRQDLPAATRVAMPTGAVLSAMPLASEGAPPCS